MKTKNVVVAFVLATGACEARPTSNQEEEPGGTTTASTVDGTDANGTTTGGAEGTTAAPPDGGTVDPEATTDEPEGSTDASSSSGGEPAADDSLDLPELGSLVIMGDSIGDGGGPAPYYYDLLRASFEARYGVIAYYRVAESGSETDALLGQANGLPAALPGPVVVMITSGGNDMKANIAPIITGTDGPQREIMGANIAAALDVLVAPGRFGPGVEAFVLHANIYDSSDGEGNFGANGCAFGAGLPPIMTDPHFENWNAVIEDVVDDYQQTPVDMHGHFYGHGFNSPDVWYAPDCTHPNTAGHDALHRLVYEAVTGEAAT